MTDENRHVRIRERRSSPGTWTAGRFCDSARDALAELMIRATAIRDAGKGALVTYSRKVFIPLTELCRDVCHYCTYAKTPRRVHDVYLSAEQVLDIARRAGKGSRLPRGLVHARRQTGTALSRSARSAGCVGLRIDARISRANGRTRDCGKRACCRT